MNRIKKSAMSVMAFLLVLCVGYFSVMSPTSAWFYESGVVSSGDSFVFGDLSVNSEFMMDSEVTFDAATEFSDPEEILFDEVANVDEITVFNRGTIPARIYISVKDKAGKEGLFWFAFTEDMFVENSVKKTIAQAVPLMTDEALRLYNEGTDGTDGHYFLIAPGESKVIKIASWIDYSTVSSQLRKGEKAVSYDAEIRFTATQDVDGAIEK